MQPKPKPPNTTPEQDRHSAAQRSINRIWEVTQAAIAVGVTVGTIYAALRMVESPELTNAFFLVIGFYFGRTNHQRSGGIGGDVAGPR